MKIKRKIKSYLALLMSVFFMIMNCNITAWAQTTTEESGNSFKQVIEFEDANRFSSDSGNGIRNNEFSGYSGNGYVYLASGWAEVNFTVPSDGNYKITIVSNSDQYKENWLYLDDNGAGTLYTNAGSWNKATNEYTLSAGQHKFGVSSNWGYVALDYVIVESVDNGTGGGTGGGEDVGPGEISDISEEKVTGACEKAKGFLSD